MDVGTPQWLSTREQRAWRAYLAMQAQLTVELNRRLQAGSGLSLSDFDVLVALTDRRGERIRIGELSEVLKWEKSRLSHHVTRMQRRGLVVRVECPDDGRGAELELTEQGRTAIEHAAPGHVHDVRELLFDGLDDEQVAALEHIGTTVTERIAADKGRSPDTPSRPRSDDRR